MSSIYKPGATQEKPRSLGKGRKSQQPQPDSLARLSAPYDDNDNNGNTPTKCKNDSVYVGATKPMHSEIDSLYQSTDQGGKGPQNILYQSSKSSLAVQRLPGTAATAEQPRLGNKNCGRVGQGRNMCNRWLDPK